ncbi:ATP-binding protein [Amycolatopsis jejuensis]|uniref:ATP-binding protein n=1 Tax=Amycolatopsis jejuensis TaxID=330084 RepID=UPI000AA0390C|nr:ATP-binding protein [Amycolatopsis jejuensis]
MPARVPERTAADLLATFGHTPTPAPTPPLPAGHAQERINRAVAPLRGHARAGHGWSPVLAPLPVYHASTHDIGGLFPLLVASPMPAVGARIGYDVLSGGAFYCHPIEWVLRSGLATNPNIALFGEPGRGKSSTVVAFVLRMLNFGVRTLISGDVKGEYTPVVRALGATPIELGAGNHARINALDLGPLTTRWDTWTPQRQRDELTSVLGRWVQLLTALTESQGHPPTVTDEAALAAVLHRLVGATDANTRLRPITIPHVHHELANPDPQLWHDLRYAGRHDFLDQLRPVTDALANLISGALAGLFDGPTTVDIDWHAPVQSMDLSRLRSRGDTAVAVALTCLGAWSSLATDLRSDGDIRIVVRDESWRQLRLGPRAVATIDAELRLSRLEQTIQILVLHKLSDLLSVGASGSQAAAIAKDLIALCSTRVLFGQSTRVADDLADALALTRPEQQRLTGSVNERRGRALWKTENHPAHLVQTVLSSFEKRLFDTNAQLRPPRIRKGTRDDRPH